MYTSVCLCSTVSTDGNMYCLWRSHGFPLRFLFLLLLPLLRYRCSVVRHLSVCLTAPFRAIHSNNSSKTYQGMKYCQELNLLRSVKVPPKSVPHILCNVKMKVSKFFKNEFSFKLSTNSTLNRMASWRYLSRMG